VLAAFEKEHRSQPLKVIGIERQGSSDAEIKAMAKDKGAEFTLISDGEYTKQKLSGLPRAYVFDHTGRQIYEGNPAEAETVAAKAIEAVPAIWLPADASFTKLKPLAAQALARKNLGQLLTALRAKGLSADEAEKTEAETLQKIVEGYATRRRESLASTRESDPDGYVSGLDALSKEFSGDPIAAECKSLKDQACADPAFAKLRSACKALATQEKLLADLAPCKICKGKSQRRGSMDCADCLRTNAETLEGVKKALLKIQKANEGTAVAAKAAELAAKL